MTSRPSLPTSSPAPPSATPRWRPRYLADKDEARAKALAQKAWIDLDIPASLEPAFLKRVGALLTEADHKRRLDRLLLQRQPLDRRAQRARGRHPPRHRPAVGGREEEGGSAPCRVPARQELHPAPLQAARAQPDRLGPGRAEGAGPAPPEERGGGLEDPAGRSGIDQPGKPDGWWEERRANAYAALRMGKPKMAYELVRNPGPLSVNAAKDASFLAGWLALRHLHDAKLALGHFEALAKAADGPLSHARGQYWLGRTYEALGDKAKAQEHYKAASAYFDTFHGQLARLKVDAAAHALNITPPAAPTRRGDRPLQRLRCRVGRRDRAQGRPRRQPRARVPLSSAQPPEERGRGGHGRAPGRGAGRHANGRAHRQGAPSLAA